MKYNIQEELEKFKLLTKYDSSKTLNENISDLNEQAVPMGYVPTIKTAANPPAAQTQSSNVTAAPSGGNVMTDIDKLADSIATTIGQSVNGPGTDEASLVNAINQIKDRDLFDKVSYYLFLSPSKRTTEYSGWQELFNGELGQGNEDIKAAKDIQDKFKTFGVSVAYKIRQPEQGQGIGVTDNSFIVTDGGAKKTDAAVVKKPKVVIPIPTELKDIDGVKSFQDWADANQAGWATGFPEGKLNKGAGYGAFGPRTSKAWTSYGKEYLQAIQNRQVDAVRNQTINDLTGTLKPKTTQLASAKTTNQLVNTTDEWITPPNGGEMVKNPNYRPQ